eukprot:TRINITY_DN1256_c0_g2_i1.p1 TRINITY_DN1256_c0_g2~~TRINITY_DN1256_c0_g2_i1.p1  ORF type:complete len:664 (+),score=122.79 TRINITY_DN1256_c0_g2_i1:39-2030(+)
MTEILNGSSSLSDRTHKKRRKYLEDEEKSHGGVATQSKLVMSTPEVRRSPHIRSSGTRKMKQSDSTDDKEKDKDKSKRTSHKKTDSPKPRSEGLIKVYPAHERKKSSCDEDSHKSVLPSAIHHSTHSTHSTHSRSGDSKRKKKIKTSPPSSDDETELSPNTPSSNRRRATVEEEHTSESLSRTPSKRRATTEEETTEVSSPTLPYGKRRDDTQSPSPLTPSSARRRDDTHSPIPSPLTPSSMRRRAIEEDLVFVPTTRKREDSEGLDNSSKKIPKSDDVLEEEVERLQDFFVDDAGALLNQFEKTFGEITRDLRKPNVLLTGITGAGKSSLINAIFGQNLAQTGAGVPITQHFTKYATPDMGVVIYDSKGLEHGHFQDFIDSTNTFFDSHHVSENGESADAIHVIWYIINSAHSRFEPFEETICRKLFNRVPILFILNKADISSPSDRNRLREIITDMNLPNCVGVYDVVATPQSCKIELDECPKCHSDDIIIKRRQAMMLCESCGHEQSVKANDGLEIVIRATTQALPKVVRGAFISAQSVSFRLKEERSHQVIMEFWKDYSTVRSSARLVKIIVKMMASLSLVWEFKKHGTKYGTTLARDLIAGLNWKAKLGLLMRQSDDQRLHCCALGTDPSLYCSFLFLFSSPNLFYLCPFLCLHSVLF